MTFLRIVTAAALLATLGGCTAEAPAPAPTTTAAQIPTPSATPEPGLPTPLLDLVCSDLASTQNASEIIGTAVTSTDLNAGPGFSWAMQIQQLGGISCEWNDGNTENDSYDGTFREFTVTVMPESEDKYRRYADAYGYPDDEYRYCYARDTYICGYFALVDGAWIDSYIWGIRPSAVAEDDDAGMVEHVRPFFDSIAAAVREAEPVDSRWRPVAIPLPTDCEAFIDPADIAALTLSPAPVDSITYTDGPQVSQTLSMDDVYLTKTCNWFYVGSEGSLGSMSATPGGAWAWNVQAEARGSTPMDVEGLPDGEKAYYQCSTSMSWSSSQCELNFALRGNWMTLRLYEGDSEFSYPYAADQPEVLVAVAEKIIANLS